MRTNREAFEQLERLRDRLVREAERLRDRMPPGHLERVMRSAPGPFEADRLAVEGWIAEQERLARATCDRPAPRAVRV